MRLYHFTAAHLVDSILAQGIKFGRIPRTLKEETDNRPAIVGVEVGWQWLTINPDFAAQIWQSGGSLPYRRDDFRFSVDLPERAICRLFHWLSYCKPFNDPVHADMNSDGHPENWFVFKGEIDREWIVGLDPNPCIISACNCCGKRPSKLKKLFSGRSIGN